jgi:hypothetical protein
VHGYTVYDVGLGVWVYGCVGVGVPVHACVSGRMGVRVRGSISVWVSRCMCVK